MGRLSATDALRVAVVSLLLAGHASAQTPAAPEEPSPALAPRIAELFVEPDGARLRMEVPVDDAGAGAPLRLGIDGGPALEPRVVSDELGTRLARDPVTGAPSFADALDPDAPPETVRRVELVYPFPERPRALVIDAAAPPAGRAASPLGLRVEHDGVAVVDFRFLDGPAVLDLDWSDPWYSRFRDPALRRRYTEPAAAYLYVEPYQVRLEVVARLADLAPWPGDLAAVDAPRAELLAATRELVSRHAGLAVEGVTASPVVEHTHLLDRTEQGTAVLSELDALDPRTAFVGVILAIPTERLAHRVTVSWDRFGGRIEALPLTLTVARISETDTLAPGRTERVWEVPDPAGASPAARVVEVPPAAWRVLAWRAAPALVVLGLALGLLAGVAMRGGRRAAAVAAGLILIGAGAGALADRGRARLSEERAHEVLGALLHNVYRAFDFREEGRIYDALATSVAGPLLRDTYLEVRGGLELANQGGARTTLEELELLSTETEPLPAGVGFRARVEWSVRGTVEHWGHLHERTNRYAADVRVEPVAGRYRLTELDLIQELRL